MPLTRAGASRCFSSAISPGTRKCAFPQCPDGCERCWWTCADEKSKCAKSAEVMAPQVVIVGAGPVGLTLAIDLGMRQIRCLLVEQKAKPQFLPKMERCNARTMEMFGRIGIADT